MKNVFVKIINSIFPPKYTRYSKNVKKQILYFEEIYKFAADHSFHRSFFLFSNEKYY